MSNTTTTIEQLNNQFSLISEMEYYGDMPSKEDYATLESLKGELAEFISSNSAILNLRDSFTSGSISESKVFETMKNLLPDASDSVIEWVLYDYDED